MEGTIKKQIEKVLAETLGQIRGGYEANPQPARFTDLLEHPKALADYKTGEDIGALLARSATITPDIYREGIKHKILSLESSIFKAEETKDKVMEFLTKLPDFATDKIFATFEWLFKLPLIGDLIAAFFGYQSGKNLIEDLKIETKDRKSLQKLFEYGIGKDEKQKIKKGSENGKIKLLEDIDFSNVSYKQIRPFYKILRTNRIDPNVDGFW